MRVSVDWLKEYVEIDLPPEKVAHRLTMAGLEVEHIDMPGEKFNGFVIGRVLEVAVHPNADRLKVAKVNVGKEVLQIVCGAPNVAAGQKVFIGLIGAVVPHNQHDPEGKPFELSKVKIRGVESSGMICSAKELGIGEDGDGIVVLNTETKIGTPISSYLGLDGVAFEVGITPNRVDAMSHIGIAREIAAATDKALKMPGNEVQESGKSASSAIRVTIEDEENCPRYTVRVVMGVNVKESPEWLQHNLKMAGLRPINNIVDVTNYVLMEIGHPIHAFDYDQIAGHEIRIRRAKNGELFTTLDKKPRKLNDSTLMICDGERPVAIAGVMGGLNSEISAKTKNVLIEGAYFSAKSVRRTSKMLGLSTDASQRFERGADPNCTEWAVARVAHLIQKVAGGEVLKGVVDEYPHEIVPRKIAVRIKKANEILGTTLEPETVIGLLEKIQLEVGSAKGKDFSVEVKVPTFRPDLEREIDIIEEIARLHGYDNIATERRVSIQLGEAAPPIAPDDLLRTWMSGRTFREVYSHSLVDESMASMGDKIPVELANPNSKEMAVMRTSLSSGLLRITGSNIAHGNRDLRLFELGKVYGKAGTGEKATVAGYSEDSRICLLLSGRAQNPAWGGVPDRQCDVFDLKGEIEALFAKISLDKFNFIPYTTSNPLSDDGADIEIYGVRRGYFGKVKRELLQKFDIEQDVFVAELNLDWFENSAGSARRYKPLPLFPSSYRDLALIVDEKVPAGDLLAEIGSAGGQLLVRTDLFDVYRGGQTGAGKKSCAYALEFQSRERTLEQAEVDALVQTIVQKLGSKFGAALRS